MAMNRAMEMLARIGVVPVVVIENEADALPLMKAMKAGGILAAEITLRTPAGLSAIRQITALNDPEIVVGAGSVLTEEQCREAIDAGAQFIVSPGFCEEVVKCCADRNVVAIPGCVTPSEIMRAMACGVKTVKFFPANVYGGLSAMKALHGPFPGISFVPTGGVNSENLQEYLKAPFIHAVGGSWLCSKKDILDNNFERITALCREARDCVDAIREGRA